MTAKGRGFAVMNEDKQREIASRGGRAAHKRGTAHEFTAEEAAAAGRKGGQSVSRNREHMARIGRKGGLATHNRRSAETDQPLPNAEDRKRNQESEIMETPNAEGNMLPNSDNGLPPTNGENGRNAEEPEMANVVF
jgi:general stress protein YciG